MVDLMTQDDFRPYSRWIIFGVIALMVLGRYVFFLIPLAVVAGVLWYLFKQKKITFDFTQPSVSAKNARPAFNFIHMPSAQFKWQYAAYGVAALVVFLIIIDGLVSVPAGHVGVIYDRGRGVLLKQYDEGLHLKIPFWQVATIMDTRMQVYTMSVDEKEKATYSSEPIEALTLDGQRVEIDATAQFRVPAESAATIYKNIGLDYIEKVIKPGARSVIRNAITGYDSTKLFTEASRTEASAKMEAELRKVYADSNVQLVALLLRNVRFSDVYLKAIEDKQVAQQRIQKAEYERQEAEKVKERKIIEAEAEAQAIKLKGETLRANPSVIQFEFVQKMAPNINWGILPQSAIPLLDLKALQGK
ncbi:prohibitin family protein [Candidatus Uhrbacteria bacterium]|nr:prohibitin family protein [Candidatus Uhrbacteria bacterium]